MKITIFGAGAFGTALGGILEENGHQIDYYDPIKYPEKSLTSIIGSGDVNLLAVSSSAAPKLLLFLPHDKPLICAGKGFLTAASFKPFSNFSALSGGAFAADLKAKQPTVLTATSPLIKQLFSTNWLSFDETTDISGVLLCGALKNIYAIGSGYWELKYGTTDFDDFINTALSEMKTILTANGSNPETANLSCGIRDLVITCASAASRNYEFGMKLKRNPELGEKVISGSIRIGTVEGIGAVASMSNTPSFKKPSNTPILDRIIALIKNEPVELTTGEEAGVKASQPAQKQQKTAQEKPTQEGLKAEPAKTA